MINEIEINLRNYFDRCSWGIVYYDEDGSVFNSNYCDDAAECISSIKAHKDHFTETCMAYYSVPAVHYGVNSLASVMEEINAYLKELDLAD